VCCITYRLSAFSGQTYSSTLNLCIWLCTLVFAYWWKVGSLIWKLLYKVGASAAQLIFYLALLFFWNWIGYRQMVQKIDMMITQCNFLSYIDRTNLMCRLSLIFFVNYDPLYFVKDTWENITFIFIMQIRDVYILNLYECFYVGEICRFLDL